MLTRELRCGACVSFKEARPAGFYGHIKVGGAGVGGKGQIEGLIVFQDEPLDTWLRNTKETIHSLP